MSCRFWTPKGPFLIALRVRDVQGPIFSFGLSGRDPVGKTKIPGPGAYELAQDMRVLELLLQFVTGRCHVIHVERRFKWLDRSLHRGMMVSSSNARPALLGMRPTGLNGMEP